MITTILIQYIALVPVALVTAIVLVGIAGLLLHRLRMTRTITVLTALSLAAVFALTLTPGGMTYRPMCTFGFEDPLDDPGALANIGLFVPLALGATLLSRRPVRVLAAASGLSALIELVQALLPALGRACDTNDWATNTVGAAIGVVLAVAVVRLGRRRSRLAASSEDRTTLDAGSDPDHEPVTTLV